MQDAQDDKDGFRPTELDRSRIADIQVHGRVEAENSQWVLLRYPPAPTKPNWHEFTLCVTALKFSGMFELRSQVAVLRCLAQLEADRIFIEKGQKRRPKR